MSQKETPSLTLGPSRKSRTKIRKPKLLSLRLAVLSQEDTQHPGQMPADHHHQLNLFPLHPENLVEDHKDTHDDDVVYFFSAADGDDTTLTGLLGAGTASSSASDEENYNNVTNTAIALSTPETLTYAYGGQDSEEGDQQLVRTAMRNKEREETSEEKWVCYSEVTNSSSGTVSVCDLRWKSDEEKMIQRRKRLSLKLDYEEIMNIWCDNIHLEYSSSSQPQVVPDFHHDDDDLFDHPTTSNEVQGGEWKIGQREASVLRYKEKRQNRLFSKKIRYEVRKLNAEKRPRIKGRFAKR